MHLSRRNWVIRVAHAPPYSHIYSHTLGRRQPLSVSFSPKVLDFAPNVTKVDSSLSDGSSKRRKVERCPESIMTRATKIPTRSTLTSTQETIIALAKRGKNAFLAELREQESPFCSIVLKGCFITTKSSVRQHERKLSHIPPQQEQLPY